MKKIIYSLVSIIALTATFNSCVTDTDYETPQIACDFQEADLEGSAVTIESILGQWLGQNDEDGNGVVDYYESESPYVYEFDNTNYVSGYVISDDRTGNFYKELYLVDTPTNPTYSIKLAIDLSGLYTKYDVGRKVFVHLRDLGINRIRGEMVLGEMINSQVDDIRENKVNENVFRNCEAVAVTPITLASPSEITSNHIGMLVQLDNMQFDLDLVGLPFVDAYDSYDSHRLMANCTDNSQIYLETSTFANFKDNILPDLKGSVTGVLTRDYDDSFYVLRVSDPDDFTFEGERCDPEIVDCGLADSHGPTVLFEDDFESYLVNDPIGEEWTNYMQEGDEQWEAYNDANSLGISARLNPYNNGSSSIVTWLITPMINMDNQSGEVFSFKTSNSFSDDSTLDILISNDWDGVEANIPTATWAIVAAATVVHDDTPYQQWTDSGLVDLSCVTGNVYVAFKYKGDGGDISSDNNGTYELDEVKITSD